MKKFLLFPLIALFLFGVYLLAPLGLFVYSVYSLDFSQGILLHEINAISPLLMTEQRLEVPEEPEFSIEFITFSIHEEDLGDMLCDALEKEQRLLFPVEQIDMQISPEMVSLTISWAYHLLGYQLYHSTVFSEWFVRVDTDDSGDTIAARVEVKPHNLHTDGLHSVNWADVWQYVSQLTSSEEWLALFSEKEGLPIRDILLQDDQIVINVNL